MFYKRKTVTHAFVVSFKISSVYEHKFVDNLKHYYFSYIIKQGKAAKTFNIYLTIKKRRQSLVNMVNITAYLCVYIHTEI